MRSLWLLKIAATLVAIISLVSCGGGGGGGGVAPGGSTPDTVSGTVAIGAPLAGATVELLYKNFPVTNGAAIPSTTTDSNGHYSFNVKDLQPPYVIKAYTGLQSSNPVFSRMVTIALKPGIANVTPLSDLLTTQLLIRSAPYSYGPFDYDDDETVLLALTQSQVDTARQVVEEYLLHRPSKFDQSVMAPVDVSTVTDFVSTKFTPQQGDRYDDSIELLAASLVDSENIFGLEEHLLNQSVTALNLATSGLTGISCSFNLCGQPLGGLDIGAPFVKKQAVVKAMAAQFALHGAVALNCGGALAAAGINAGANVFFLDGPVLRINTAAYNFHLLSATETSVLLGSSSGSYMTKFSVKTANGNSSDIVSLTFNTNREIVLAEISRTRSGNGATTTCIP